MVGGQKGVELLMLFKGETTGLSVQVRFKMRFERNQCGGGGLGNVWRARPVLVMADFNGPTEV